MVRHLQQTLQREEGRQRRPCAGKNHAEIERGLFGASCVEIRYFIKCFCLHDL